MWLCRPGSLPDPCAGDRHATSELADGSTAAVPSVAGGAPSIDCFYLYPTVSRETTANADLVIQRAEIKVAASQAARFSAVCRVWAPMYRQQTSIDLNREGLSGNPAVEQVAYTSALAAWRDYLAHDNRGRPIVFIGHSQGAAILIRLLSEEIDPNPELRARMLSAILLGGNVQVASGSDVGGSFQHIAACRSATDAHCVIAYSAFGESPPESALFARPGTGISLQSGQRAVAGQSVVCTNPAALGGGTGELQPYFLSTSRPVGGLTIHTRWVTYPHMYRAECRNAGGATWLQVDHIGGAGDVRPKVVETLGPTWGYHLDEVNLTLGNLVALVGSQARALH